MNELNFTVSAKLINFAVVVLVGNVSGSDKNIFLVRMLRISLNLDTFDILCSVYSNIYPEKNIYLKSANPRLRTSDIISSKIFWTRNTD